MLLSTRGEVRMLKKLTPYFRYIFCQISNKTIISSGDNRFLLTTLIFSAPTNILDAHEIDTKIDVTS